jgi:hypothetical protein
MNDEHVMTFVRLNVEFTVAVSTTEQLPEDSQVRSKHVAINYNFNVTLN